MPAVFSSFRLAMACAGLTALGVVACGPVPISDGNGSSGMVDATSPATSLADDGTSAATVSEATDSGELPPNACGNGVLDPSERCDGGDDCAEDCLHRVIPCDGFVFACGNTLDEDGDGLIDFDDPDCLSPCDDDERELRPGAPQPSVPEVLDCYWDDNTTVGDDDCRHGVECDPASPGAPWGYEYRPELDCSGQQASPTCLQRCGPMVPNGCDCFGCCEVGGKTIFLGMPGSTPDDPLCPADDLSTCPSCTIRSDCFNPCDRAACELCFLDDPTDLADGCDAPVCEGTAMPCATTYDCPDPSTCLGGCCLPYLVTP